MNYVTIYWIINNYLSRELLNSKKKISQTNTSNLKINIPNKCADMTWDVCKISLGSTSLHRSTCHVSNKTLRFVWESGPEWEFAVCAVTELANCCPIYFPVDRFVPALLQFCLAIHSTCICAANWEAMLYVTDKQSQFFESY